MTVNDLLIQRTNSYKLESSRIQAKDNHNSVCQTINKCRTTDLIDETCRGLFESSASLLDDIFSRPLLIDYFNVYLSLPIFGQRVLCHRLAQNFDFDPPLVIKDETSEQIYAETKEWLIHCRLDTYIYTDIYIESLLILLLMEIDQNTDINITFHTLVQSRKESYSQQRSEIFSTVVDVRHFYQFLRLTPGIKYWNFFIDSMRLLQSRYSNQTNRIDTSYLNFISKYYSRRHEFRSISINVKGFQMPDSTTSDSIWFQMAINAVHQLRLYWLPRYLSTLPKDTHSLPLNINTKHQEPERPSTSEASVYNSYLFQTVSITNEPKFKKMSINSMSYIDYNPSQYIHVQSLEHNDIQQDFEEQNDHNDIECHLQIQRQPSTQPLANRSIEDYAINDNLELFYHILVSDSLAGSPFLEYLTQTTSEKETIFLQASIHCISDAEILFSIQPGILKEKILKQFISRYLLVTCTEILPDHIFDNVDKERHQLIQELLVNHDHNQCALFWKFLLKITQYLIPYFLNYIKFDRFRRLINGKISNVRLIIDDLKHIFPLINFNELLLTNSQHVKSINSKQTFVNESEISSKEYLVICDHHQQRNDFLTTNMDAFQTTEKQINTDESCKFKKCQQSQSLVNDEMEQELKMFSTEFENTDIKTMHDQSSDVQVTYDSKSLTTFVAHPMSHMKVDQGLMSHEYLKMSSIETFILDVISSARELFEVDRFISNVMNDSFNLFQTNPLLKSTKFNSDTSSLSFIDEEVSVTDSLSTTTLSKLNIENTDPHVFLTSTSSDSTTIIELQQINGNKFLSLHGSYFINSPSALDRNDDNPNSLEIKYEHQSLPNSINPLIENYLKENDFKSIKAFSLHKQLFDSYVFYGSVKEFNIGLDGISRVSIDLNQTNILCNKNDILKFNNKIKLYKTNHVEFLSANINSYVLNANQQDLYLYLDNFHLPMSTLMNIEQSQNNEMSLDQFIRFAHKDKSSEIKNSIIKKTSTYLQSNEQRQLIEFIHNEIHNYQWPLEEYIGIQGQRSWRALKLAADITNLDDEFMSNYYNAFDWMSTNNNNGSFNQRTYLIVRNYQRRIEQQSNI